MIRLIFVNPITLEMKTISAGDSADSLLESYYFRTFDFCPKTIKKANSHGALYFTDVVKNSDGKHAILYHYDARELLEEFNEFKLTGKTKSRL
ncbi:chondroitin sulfate proteoglycan 4-like [Pectobacterium phage POP12]|nr:chondroitin sulfate proteoglycan 4-like [Pectobacterium phage POP12]